MPIRSYGPYAAVKTLLLSLQSCDLIRVAVRGTAAEKKLRVATVYGHLCNGWSRGQIIQFGDEEWGVSESMCDRYIAEARIKIDQDCNLSRQAFLAECLERLRNYEQQAAKRGQMQVATNSVRLQAELVGLTGKSA